MEKRQMRVDWFYRRTGWTSCKKAQEVLGPTEVVEYGNASKEKLSEEQVKVLVNESSQIHVAKVKRTLTFDPQQDDQEEILKSILGRSGTLRAPTLRIGSNLIVGYNDDLYRQIQQSLT